jgi:hypothetical protein
MTAHGHARLRRTATDSHRAARRHSHATPHHVQMIWNREIELLHFLREEREA